MIDQIDYVIATLFQDNYNDIGFPSISHFYVNVVLILYLKMLGTNILLLLLLEYLIFLFVSIILTFVIIASHNKGYCTTHYLLRALKC